MIRTHHKEQHMVTKAIHDIMVKEAVVCLNDNYDIYCPDNYTDLSHASKDVNYNHGKVNGENDAYDDSDYVNGHDY